MDKTLSGSDGSLGAIPNWESGEEADVRIEFPPIRPIVN